MNTKHCGVCGKPVNTNKKHYKIGDLDNALTRYYHCRCFKKA